MKLTDYNVQRNGDFAACPLCGKMFSFIGLPSHFHRKHNPNSKHLSANNGWNKGLTKESDPRIAAISKKVSNALAGKPRRPLDAKHKQNIADSMRRAHEEGRAHNIGQSRWNNEASYPEQFFLRVIENEFHDKGAVREFPVGRFSLDFAWPQKRKCIEIDGDQHLRFEEYRQRDARKDALLAADGWQILRISWKAMCVDTKYWIQRANAFIGK